LSVVIVPRLELDDELVEEDGGLEETELTEEAEVELVVEVCVDVVDEFAVRT